LGEGLRPSPQRRRSGDLAEQEGDLAEQEGDLAEQEGNLAEQKANPSQFVLFSNLQMEEQ